MLGGFEVRDGLLRDLDEDAEGGFVWEGDWPVPEGIGNLGSDMEVDLFPCMSPVGSFAPTDSACMTLWVMCGSGVRVGMTKSGIGCCAWRILSSENVPQYLSAQTACSLR
ncbi:MAG: hypothetical protein M2R45_02558 [Verrucomicrobia subdivision 3 bacterium]|nr:hypothetical protein [Limisphaerales bacterium]MCS1414235.1 hypothetical protein [Limisphaerales bacterium]